MRSSPSKISDELKDRIRAAVNLVDVVSEHVNLRKSGSNYSGLCPFHNERSPSFSVSEVKQLYHCYGCKEGGDLFSFVMKIHNLSFPEALEELANRAKIALPKELAGASGDPEVQKKRNEQAEKSTLAFKLNRFAAAYFYQELSRQTHVDSYFRHRGITDSDLRRSFYLGAAAPHWDHLAQHLIEKKAPIQLATELGLIKPSTPSARGGPGYFDLFRNRAMFPILDSRGRVVGFGGRALALPEGAPEVGGESPKYLNSSESLIFQKSKILYGLFQAQKYIREKDEVILVEGYFDVLGLVAAGFKNVVATCGTALTAAHLQVLQRIASRVILLFDSDAAGIAATERAMELGLDHGWVLFGATLPPQIDPDEILFDPLTGLARPEGRAALEAILKQSEPVLDQRLNALYREARMGPEAQSQAVKQIAGWLGRFKDAVGREIRLANAAERLGVSADLIQRATGASGAPQVQAPNHRPIPVAPKRSAPTSGATRAAPPTRSPKSRARLSPKDVVLLKALSQGQKYAPLFERLGSDLPSEMTFSDVFDYFPVRDFLASLEADPAVWARFKLKPTDFLTDQLDPQVRSILVEASVHGSQDLSDEDVSRAFGRAAAHAWARFSQKLRTALADAEAKKDAGLHSKLMQEYLDVQRKMKEFDRFYDEA